MPVMHDTHYKPLKPNNPRLFFLFSEEDENTTNAPENSPQSSEEPDFRVCRKASQPVPFHRGPIAKKPVGSHWVMKAVSQANFPQTPRRPKSDPSMLEDDDPLVKTPSQSNSRQTSRKHGRTAKVDGGAEGTLTPASPKTKSPVQRRTTVIDFAKGSETVVDDQTAVVDAETEPCSGAMATPRKGRTVLSKTAKRKRRASVDGNSSKKRRSGPVKSEQSNTPSLWANNKADLVILTSKLDMVTTIFVDQDCIAIQDDGEVELSMFVPPFSTGDCSRQSVPINSPIPLNVPEALEPLSSPPNAPGGSTLPPLSIAATSNSRLPVLLFVPLPRYGYASLGYFRNLGIISKTSTDEGNGTTWHARLRWVADEEYGEIEDETVSKGCWWSEQKVVEGLEDKFVRDQCPGLGIGMRAVERWWCRGCGRVNRENGWKWRRCLSEKCNDKQPEFSKALSLDEVRGRNDRMPMARPHEMASVPGTMTTTWEDGTVTYMYPLSASRLVKHIFTGNYPPLQEDASKLWVGLQGKGVELIRDGPYYTCAFVGNRENWPESIKEASGIVGDSAVGYGEFLSGMDIQRIEVLAWFIKGTAKFKSYETGAVSQVLCAKQTLVGILSLGCEVEIFLHKCRAVVELPSPEGLLTFKAEDETELVMVDAEPLIAKPSSPQKKKVADAGDLSIHMVHGDVLILSGDDFEYNIKRSGSGMHSWVRILRLQKAQRRLCVVPHSIQSNANIDSSGTDQQASSPAVESTDLPDCWGCQNPWYRVSDEQDMVRGWRTSDEAFVAPCHEPFLVDEVSPVKSLG
ncbi:hypothetical protein ARMSODRAFT_1068680 [Armillaria solidipes]|uniref:Uncharacterized protein n=1 Tax=Armillaria solidipes TaxID=1076256 RepID=A0A2H3B6X5_9AGAR|nr:hypothetical protein ARMSODRAFT_1068680 [Armillaria solidipes]